MRSQLHSANYYIILSILCSHKW